VAGVGDGVMEGRVRHRQPKGTVTDGPLLYTTAPTLDPTAKQLVLQKVRDTLRTSRHLSVAAAVAQVNPILRGCVNYFRVGNSSQAFNKVQYHVERKVRRFAAKQRKRTGFGWKRWSSDIVYGSWGLFRDYHLAIASAKARTDWTEP
jgi:RNA-directed DNA polymerase